MTDFHFADSKKGPFNKDHFDIRDLQDEIRADELCGHFLQIFYRAIVEDEKFHKEDAGLLAHGADYFLREFVIPDRRENIFELSPGRVRQFAGNWYIIKNLEPNMKELRGILQGIEAFYQYCEKTGMVSSDILDNVHKECADLEFYRQRIESFWAIEGDGYQRWEQECSLKQG
jgi:hypothetical protein